MLSCSRWSHRQQGLIPHDVVVHLVKVGLRVVDLERLRRLQSQRMRIFRPSENDSGQELSDRRVCYRGLDLRLQLFLAGLEIVLEVPLLLVVVGHLLRDLGLVRIALHA